MTIDPRRRFLEDPAAVRRHADLFSNPELQHWLTIAFAEYCLNLPGSRGAADAMDSNSRRDGAREYMNVLMNLSNQLPARPRISDNLTQ